jgi:alkanesulfonate monooxygenase SsuD/methylene tetrahydromethanopterin reductase-like flavin-dependent oxidoreductase (luciferase family)
MIDHLLRGRFIMGISPGGLMSDAEVFGNYKKDRNAIFLESINMVLDIWAKEPPYRLQGNFFHVTTENTSIPEIGQGAILKPYQKPHPPIVVTAVAPHSKGVTEAAKRGWTPVSANFLLPEWVASHWPRYVEGCEASGRKAEACGLADCEVDLRCRKRQRCEALWARARGDPIISISSNSSANSSDLPDVETSSSWTKASRIRRSPPTR